MVDLVSSGKRLLQHQTSTRETKTLLQLSVLLSLFFRLFQFESSTGRRGNVDTHWVFFSPHAFKSLQRGCHGYGAGKFLIAGGPGEDDPSGLINLMGVISGGAVSRRSADSMLESLNATKHVCRPLWWFRSKLQLFIFSFLRTSSYLSSVLVCHSCNMRSRNS